MAYREPNPVTHFVVSGEDNATPASDNGVTLVAGSGVTLTTGTNAVTIAASGGSGFSVTSLSATVTLGEIQSANDAATTGSKMWYVEPSSWSVPAGKTLLGLRCELRNSLWKASSSKVQQSCPIGFADPSGSTIMPSILSYGWNGGSNYSPSYPSLQAQPGPSFGWYYQDDSFNDVYIVNDGGTSTDYLNSYAAVGVYFGSLTQLRVYFNETQSSSNTYQLTTGTTTSSAVIANLTMYYA
ncbi:MAG: hypothetical protein ACJZ00_00005 [Cytophagales bacterium]